ncbi:MAG TPA: helix-turn-helix domain-containing protein [Acidimicrobiia bacterium]|nr:helix-turn-helix domain-containing protein [Acidimicrobiia bacterium]
MNTESATSLRDRQAEQLRDELRHQFVNLVLEKGFEGFTMQDVADAAGVSVRTVYRYFPSREAFAEDLRKQARRGQQEMESRRGPGHWMENPEFFAATFESFEGRADLIRAGRAIRESGIDPVGTGDRTEEVRARLEASDDVHPEAVAQLTGVLRLLGSTDAWLRLTEGDIGLDSREAGHAVQWAMEVVMEAVKDVEGPLRPKGKGNS